MNLLGTDLLFGSVISTCVIGLMTIVLFLWYFSRNHDYWKKRGVPYVKPIPFLGSVLDQFFVPLHKVDIQRHKELGAIYGHFEGNRPMLSVGDPSLLRGIFVKDFHFFPNRRSFATGDRILDKMVVILDGEYWKRVRTIITPTFTTGKIRRMLNIFKDCANTTVQNFKDATKDGKPVEAKSIYGAFTVDVIASSAFSTKLDSCNDPENPLVSSTRKVFGLNISWRFLMFVLTPGLMRLLGISVIDPVATGIVSDITMQIIKDRKRTGEKRNDFLQLLIDTSVEVENDQNSEVAENEKEDLISNYDKEGTALKGFKNISNKNLTMDELVAQCLTFFLAGYETTSSTLALATYFLAVNPHIQDKARAEVDKFIKENNGELTYEGIQSMKYLDNVLSETLRIHPPSIRFERKADTIYEVGNTGIIISNGMIITIPNYAIHHDPNNLPEPETFNPDRLERVAEADYELGNTGITIPKGMVITIPTYTLHHDPNYFPEPEIFNPDRFTEEERTSRPQYTYMPFGAGPRNCIGMRFALTEIKVCLVQVLSNFIIKKSPQTKVPVEFNIRQILLQPKDIIINLEARKDGPAIK